MSRTNKKCLPTILGLVILVLGLVSGVILLNAKQIFKLSAEIDTTPKNIKFSNVTEKSFVLSFTTNSESRVFIKTAKDKLFFGRTDIYREEKNSINHYFDVDKLQPQTMYYVTINVDGNEYYAESPLSVKTGLELNSDNKGSIIYGKVYSKSGEELEGAIIYVTCNNGSLISSKSSGDGSWAINLSKSRTPDLTKYISFDKNSLIQILIQHGDDTSFVSAYSNNTNPLPPIIIGKNLDLRNTSALEEGSEMSIPNIFGTSSSSDVFPYIIQNIFRVKPIKTVNE